MKQKEHISYIEKHLWRKIEDFETITSWLTCAVYVHEWYIYRFEWNNNDMEEEVAVLNFLNCRLPTEIPNPVQFSKSWMKYKMLQWETMHSLWIERSANLLHEVSGFMKVLHAIPLPEFPYAYEKDTYLSDNAESIFRKLKSRLPRYLTVHQETAVYEYFDELRRYESEDLVVIHGDLNTKNILIHDWKISWIIDFSDCRVEWRALDFWQFWNQSTKVLKEVMSVYGGKYEETLYDESWFLAKRFMLFDIANDWVYENDDWYIEQQLVKFWFKNS